VTYTSPTDQHLIKVLTDYFLDISQDFAYYMDWRTWLIYKGYTIECATLMYKTDTQLNNLLHAASKAAERQRNSKLAKAMK
jgi:hypothetical protein